VKHLLAGLTLVAAGLGLPISVSASFTASFQPCELQYRQTGRGNVLARCDIDFAGKQAVVELIGTAPNHVSEVVFKSGDGSLVRRLAMSARPFIDPENVSITVRDMNFDGWPDFGIRDFSTNGPNEPWSFWLWSEAARAFVFHEQLSALPNPEVSQRLRAVRSFVEVSPGKIRTDSYEWRGDRLVLRRSTFD
jgi:hypothetical protein